MTSLPRPSGLKGFAHSAMRHKSDRPARLSVDTKPADESYFNVLSPVNNEVCTCILLTLVLDTATLTSVSRSALSTSEEAVTPEGTPKTGLLVIFGNF